MTAPTKLFNRISATWLIGLVSSLISCCISSAFGTPTLSTVASFNGSNGEYPLGGVIADSTGNLYGTTYDGGSTYDAGDPGTGYGTVFEVPAGGGPVNTLVSFDPPAAAHPSAGMTFDASGNLYGTTVLGMTPNMLNNYGTVFEVPKSGGPMKTLANFNYANGDEPMGGVTFDAAGNLYGTTELGGSSNGNVFEVLANGGGVVNLAAFNGSSARYPGAGVIVDAAGNVYGTTSGGGDTSVDYGAGDGIVFEVPAGGGSFNTLATFNGSNGAIPVASLIADSAGNLFGTTEEGGNLSLNGGLGYGTVFEVPAGGGAVKTLATFTGNNGSGPASGLIADAAGNLFGTTEYGGDLSLNGGLGYGTVFEVPAGGGPLITLATFNDTDGDFLLEI